MSSGTIWNRAGTPSYASLAAGSRIPRPASRSIRAVAMAALAIAGSFVVIPQATASGTPTVDAPATAGAAPNRRAQISGISVDPGDSTSLAVHVSTDQGTLFLEDTSGLTFSAGSQNDVAEMAFNGSAQDVEDALAALYLYPPGDFEGDATFTISVADGAAWYLPETGHYYQTSGGTEVDYTTAEAAADASFFHGMQGYLFTPTSAAEKEFVADFLLGDTGYGRGWMGASDAAVEGEWRWTEGPEGEEDGGSGRVFYRDDFDGDGNPTGFAAGAVNGEYTNWISGQPNDSWGEDYGYQFGYGGWEDRDSSSEEEYVIEYGGMSGDTPAIAQDTTTVTFEPTVPGTPRYPETSSNVYMENAVRVCWSNPEEDGGRAITGYTVYVEPQDVEPVETVSTCVWIEDLYYGTDYTFTITATNEIGEGDASDEVTGTPAAGTPNTTTTTAAPTTTTTAPRPATTTTTAPRSATTTTTVAAPVASAPDAPEITEIVPASHALVVEWEATDDGGAEIARYTVRADPTTGSAGMTLKTTSGTQVSGDTTTATVDGLTNGTEYAVTVTATNAAGTSAPSAAVRGRHAATPSLSRPGSRTPRAATCPRSTLPKESS
ncbi:MAG: fibronectin type III domain-containing protein [Acidimicrobiia bacterium]|nr:fibronectin type III domain-containing protein [Acidimicrobiia bacterium]